LEDVPVNKVEQFVKLQQMPVSSSIFFVGYILVGVGVHSLRVKSIGNHSIQSQGVGHLEGHPKNSWGFFGGAAGHRLFKTILELARRPPHILFHLVNQAARQNQWQYPLAAD